MKKIVLFFSALVVLAGCNLNTPPSNELPAKLDSIKIQRDSVPTVMGYKGLYYPHYANFVNCEDGKRYVVKNNGIIDSIYNVILPNAYTDEAVYVEMNAYVDPKDSGSILYTGNAKVEQKNLKNTCIAYEYWCTGTEPFWQVQISKEEGLIDFYNPMEQKTTHFIYAEPKIKGGVTYYTSTDGEQKISVAIKQEKCNGAFDAAYNYSARVELRGMVYNGCAVAMAK
ncbi:MAG TPA: lipoprotein [Bacteroidia bacterium]|jgi:uncharacterized membrane protein